VLRAHFFDANAAEFDLNKLFLNIREGMHDSSMLDQMEKFLRLFQNDFHGTMDAGRGMDSGIGSGISSHQIVVREVLTHIPRQLWSRPVSDRCLDPFCGACVGNDHMDIRPRRFDDINY
jgi:hypothetical protein